MKVQIQSDLHLEFEDDYPRIKPIAPVLILAGDILTKGTKEDIIKKFIDYVNTNWKYVLYVPGNHEYYHSKMTIDELAEWYRCLLDDYDNVYYLDKGKLTLNINGEEMDVYGASMFPMIENTDRMTCFKRIKMRNEKGWRVRITKEAWNVISGVEREWLLKEHDPTRRSLIISHYPITMEGVCSREYDEDPECIKSQFCSEVPLRYRGKSIVCVNGHTHYSYDFERNSIRYISNARGYKGESTGYDSDGVYEI